MATTLHEPPLTGQDPLRPGSGSGGGWRSLVPAGGTFRTASDHSPDPSRTGIWVGLAAIGMSFAAFTSALLVRQGSTDWQHFTLPRILYLNTVLLFASSVTLEVARRRVASFMGGRAKKIVVPLGWLYATLALGLLFVAGQYEAWLQLRSHGLYLPTNPSSSFFYVFTSVHVLHVLGGLGGLIAVISKLNRLVLRRSTLDATSHYWHFMGVLWLYLLLILWTKF
jgi:cytochrome c oxidase subunit III